MRYYAIIVASGSGNRMGQSLPKQFSLLNNFPMIYYSLKAFQESSYTPSIILALNPSHIHLWEELIEKYCINIPHTIVNGGIERFNSVKNCLDTIHDHGIVAIHDGARPLITSETINQIFKVATENDTAIPVIAATESARYMNKIIDRNLLSFVQTPQAFKINILQKSYLQEYDTSFTDDASVVESAGYSVHLMEGQKHNLKITYKEDLQIAEQLLKNKTYKCSL